MAIKILSNRTREIKAQVSAAFDRGLERAAEYTLAAQKRGAPVVTGNLRDSGELEKLARLVYQGRFTAPYTLAVEYGGVFTSGNPFIRRGFYEGVRNTLAFIAEEMRSIR